MKQLLPWSLVAALTMALIWHEPREAQSALQPAEAKDVYKKGWAHFDGPGLMAKLKKSGHAWMPFLRVPTLYCGLYQLKANAKDRQAPHKEDEVYCVIRGSGKFEVGSGENKETISYRTGSILFVKAGLPHRFSEISKDTELIVFFSTAKAPK